MFTAYVIYDEQSYTVRFRSNADTTLGRLDDAFRQWLIEQEHLPLAYLTNVWRYSMVSCCPAGTGLNHRHYIEYTNKRGDKVEVIH